MSTTGAGLSGVATEPLPLLLTFLTSISTIWGSLMWAFFRKRPCTAFRAWSRGQGTGHATGGAHQTLTLTPVVLRFACTHDQNTSASLQ